MMDQSNRLFTGELNQLKAALDRIDSGFKGVLQCKGKANDQAYEADILIRDGLIIAASRRNTENNETVYGKKAFEEILRGMRDKSGRLELYSLSNDELKAIVRKEEDVLLEEVKDISSLVIEDKADNATRQGDDLEKEWKDLNKEFSELDKKDKASIEGLITEDQEKKDPKKGIDIPLPAKKIQTEGPKKEEPMILKEPTLRFKDVQLEEPKLQAKQPAQIKDSHNPPTGANEIHAEASRIAGMLKTTEKPKTIAPEPAPIIEIHKPIEKPKDILPEAPQTQKPPAAPVEVPAQPTQDALEKTGQEIQEMKKNVEVYWGWDEKRQKFVGKEAPIGEKKILSMPQAPEQTKPAVKEAPLAEERILAKTVGNKDKVPTLLKSLSIKDRMAYITSPKIVRVLEKIDGKRSITDLSRDTGIPIEDVKHILEHLKSDGHLAA
jgi:hypothetical protein